MIRDKTSKIHYNWTFVKHLGLNLHMNLATITVIAIIFGCKSENVFIDATKRILPWLDSFFTSFVFTSSSLMTENLLSSICSDLKSRCSTVLLQMVSLLILSTKHWPSRRRIPQPWACWLGLGLCSSQLCNTYQLTVEARLCFLLFQLGKNISGNTHDITCLLSTCASRLLSSTKPKKATHEF